MPQILVRDLDAKVIDKLKKRAQREGRSLQSEVKMILEQAVNAPQVDMETARQLSQQFQKKFKGRSFPDTVTSIREDRDR